jgi:hypothetical protein
LELQLELIQFNMCLTAPALAEPFGDEKQAEKN